MLLLDDRNITFFKVETGETMLFVLFSQDIETGSNVDR